MIACLGVHAWDNGCASWGIRPRPKFVHRAEIHALDGMTVRDRSLPASAARSPAS